MCIAIFSNPAGFWTRNIMLFSQQLNKQLSVCQVCGVTNAKDAEFVARAGVNFIGMIMWPKAKRHVSPSVAREIASVACDNGAKAVGVFVDETPEKIWDICSYSNVNIAQLHGSKAQQGLPFLEDSLSVIYVLKANPDGTLTSCLPESDRRPDWILIDSLNGGSGVSYDWANLKVPIQYEENWILAGGLNPQNVSQAVKVAQPKCVDVSSGVCGPDGLRKDPQKVLDFIRSAVIY